MGKKAGYLIKIINDLIENATSRCNPVQTTQRVTKFIVTIVIFLFFLNSHNIMYNFFIVGSFTVEIARMMLATIVFS